MFFFGLRSIVALYFCLCMMSGCACARRGRSHARQRHELRVQFGVDDVDNKYPYVVSLRNKNRRVCTGTLIAHDWVLTAAHCYKGTYIKFSNMTLENNINNTRNITKFVAYPKKRIHLKFVTYGRFNDIALSQIEPLHLNNYGSVSALNYRSLIGYPVEYAGFGRTTMYLNKTFEQIKEQDKVRPRQLGEGLVVYCDKRFNEPGFCVAPKCSSKKQKTMPGDSGGPLFYDGKIVGILCGGSPKHPKSYWTPLSPYLDWIHDIVTHNEK